MAVKDKVQYGKKQLLLFTPEEKETLAMYQSAKAVTAKALGIGFEKISLFENSFLSETHSLESNKEALNKIAAQLSGIIAYDIFYGKRYTNIKEDLAAVKKSIASYLERFDLEADLAYADLLEQAKDLAAKTLKSNRAFIEALQKQLINDEVVLFDAIQA